MTRPPARKRTRRVITLLLCAWSSAGIEAKTEVDLNQRIRRIVEDMMQEKNAEIASLKARVQELESRLRQKPKTSGIQESVPVPASEPPSREPPAAAGTPEAAAAPPTRDERELRTMKKDLEKLKEAEAARLKFNGFFDMSAKTRNPERKTFDFGSIELDIEFQYLENFAGSGAFVWDGDTAEATVAVLDYHQFDHRTPPRGRIFLEPGFHVQGGKFDIPYALDYQYFAARDRFTVTPPLTTERIQQGGYNSEGVRTYGRWETFDYSLFWTNPLYGDKGSTLGGRLGKNFGRHPYHMAGIKPDLVGTGFSFLVDWDSQGKVRDHVYGADFSFNYAPFQLWSEALWRDARQTVFDPDGADLGRPRESAYHVTLTVSLEDWLKQSLYVFGRYGNWNPDYRALIAEDGTVYDIRPVDQLSLGFGWAVNDYVKLKFEYDDSLGTGTQEPLFVKRIGWAQLVVAF